MIVAARPGQTTSDEKKVVRSLSRLILLIKLSFSSDCRQLTIKWWSALWHSDIGTRAAASGEWKVICLLISVFVEYSALTVTCLAQLELEDNTMVAHYDTTTLYSSTLWQTIQVRMDINSTLHSTVQSEGWSFFSSLETKVLNILTQDCSVLYIVQDLAN